MASHRPIGMPVGLVLLAAAFVILSVSNGRFALPSAIWLGPPLALVGLRALPPRLALGVGAAGFMAVYIVQSAGVINLDPALSLLIGAGFGVVGFIAYAIDRMIRPRLSGVTANLVFPLALCSVEFAMGRLSPYGIFGSIAHGRRIGTLDFFSAADRTISAVVGDLFDWLGVIGLAGVVAAAVRSRNGHALSAVGSHGWRVKSDASHTARRIGVDRNQCCLKDIRPVKTSAHRGRDRKMPMEARILVGMAVLTGVMILAHVVSAMVEGRFLWALTARDSDNAPKNFGGRAERALRNQIEASAMFIPLAAALLFAHANTEGSARGALIFFSARVIYAPIYWAGIPYVRTLAFGTGLAGLGMMAIPAVASAVHGL